MPRTRHLGSSQIPLSVNVSTLLTDNTSCTYIPSQRSHQTRWPLSFHPHITREKPSTVLNYENRPIVSGARYERTSTSSVGRSAVRCSDIKLSKMFGIETTANPTTNRNESRSVVVTRAMLCTLHAKDRWGSQSSRRARSPSRPLSLFVDFLRGIPLRSGNKQHNMPRHAANASYATPKASIPPGVWCGGVRSNFPAISIRKWRNHVAEKQRRIRGQGGSSVPRGYHQ